MQPARPPLGVAAAGDQARALEHLEVSRDRGQAHGEWLRELRDGRLAVGEAGEDRATRRIGEGREGKAELVGKHLTDQLNNVSVKYQIAVCDATSLLGERAREPEVGEHAGVGEAGDGSHAVSAEGEDHEPVGVGEWGVEVA